MDSTFILSIQVLLLDTDLFITLLSADDFKTIQAIERRNTARLFGCLDSDL